MTTDNDTAGLRARMLARIDAERAAQGQPVPEWPDPVPAFTLAEYETRNMSHIPLKTLNSCVRDLATLTKSLWGISRGTKAEGRTWKLVRIVQYAGKRRREAVLESLSAEGLYSAIQAYIAGYIAGLPYAKTREIAQALPHASLDFDTRSMLANAIADTLEANCPYFNRKLFLKTCGALPS